MNGFVVRFFLLFLLVEPESIYGSTATLFATIGNEDCVVRRVSIESFVCGRDHYRHKTGVVLDTVRELYRGNRCGFELEMLNFADFEHQIVDGRPLG